MAHSSTDYFGQIISIVSPDGPIEVPLPEIDEWNLYNVQVCINYGSQIGASIVTLIALVLLSKPDKRFSIIMILNTLSLIFNIIRNVLQSLYFTGPFVDIYARYSGDFDRVGTGDTATSITATVFTLLLQISVEVSLYLQVRVVCVTLRDLYRHMLLALSGIIALLAIGFRFAYVVKNDERIVARIPSIDLLSLASATNITTCISILWFCTVFVAKLAVALRQRRKLGLVQFGPMQILFVMGFQTLIIPAIFSIYQYWGPPALASNALSACAIFLPFSALWASAAVDNQSQAFKASSKPFATYPSGFSDSSTFRQASTGALTSSNTATGTCVSSALSPNSLGVKYDLEDLERQGLAGTGDFVNSKI